MSDLLFDHPFEIDAVITWVDGSDAGWAERKSKYQNAGSTAHFAADGMSHQRWAEHDTLRYVLRSIDRFMPWVRTIFLVTDDQKPAWLAIGGKIRLVHHKDFFAPYVSRPTFNSQVIESQLHRIDGLSEHFVYFNDDVILTRPAKCSDYFYSNGTCIFYPGKHETERISRAPGHVSTSAAFKNLQALLQDAAWGEVARRAKHQPFALRKSVLAEMEDRYRAAYETLGGHRFRSVHDVAPTSQLFQYHAFINEKAVPAEDWFWYYNADPIWSLRFWRNFLTMRFQLCVCVNSASEREGKLDASYRLLMAAMRAMLSKKPAWEV